MVPELKVFTGLQEMNCTFFFLNVYQVHSSVVVNQQSFDTVAGEMTNEV